MNSAANAKNLLRLIRFIINLNMFLAKKRLKTFFCEKQNRIMSTLKGEQIKEWAQLLFVKEGLSQKEIAERTGKSAVTINRWVKEGEWTRLKQSLLVTREAQLSRMYMQLDELNSAIMKREEGQRFASSKEADTISKLANAIRTMESEASIADIVEVSKRLLNWLRPVNPALAKEVANVINDFISEILKK